MSGLMRASAMLRMGGAAPGPAAQTFEQAARRAGEAREREAEVLCGSGSTDADIAPARPICRQPLTGAQP
jgi:hypothetical protein